MIPAREDVADAEREIVDEAAADGVSGDLGRGGADDEYGRGLGQHLLADAVGESGESDSRKVQMGGGDVEQHPAPDRERPLRRRAFDAPRITYPALGIGEPPRRKHRPANSPAGRSSRSIRQETPSMTR